MIYRRNKEEYIERVNALLAIPKFANGRNKSGNDNLREILKLLGEPGRDLRFIHVAGTNGKGSVTRMIGGILKEYGFNVGLFTSPHLVSINERIELLGAGAISDEDFSDCYDAVKAAIDEHEKNGGMPLSFFEFLFAMAMVYFGEKKPDYVVLETGLGGMLDATNVVTPKVSVITSIGLDHTRYLGDTIEQVAAEKAGIIKPGVPVVYNTGEPVADIIIETRASEAGSECFNTAFISEQHDRTGGILRFSLRGRWFNTGGLSFPENTPLYQTENAMTAVTAVWVLTGGNSDRASDQLDEEALKRAFAGFGFPGRMQWLKRYVVCDGAHNPDAVERLVKSLKELHADRYGQRIRLMFAVSSDKDYETMLRQLAEGLDLSKVYVTEISGDRAVPCDYLAAEFTLALSRAGKKCPVVYGSDIKEELILAESEAREAGDLLVVAGSLYLAGEVIKMDGELI
ncbi:MAG: bifunctional folylpolyglutamate synthase/dihydrofolate synthase [Lachnospiraceae bacterium]|nr:bifunctional folylpolyglutamate synthase/dihydrofolate synthase [Lachnospiraceae bacterium]